MFRRRPKEPVEKDKGDSVLILADPGGILVKGPPGELAEVIARLTTVGSDRSHRIFAERVATVASVGAAVQTSREYVRLSPASRELLRVHGAIPGDAGYFRMFVHDSVKKIAGQLQWEQVQLGAEQALSLQISAVSMALRAAILDVQQSVERVEAKLDQVTKLLRAERLGDAMGDHRTLTALADRVRSTRRISAADWTTVAAMGPEIGRGLEGLRAHVRALLDRDGPGRTPWGRAGMAEGLLEEEWLGETLAPLAIVEHNLALWQELRIAHIGQNEHWYLTDAINDARQLLDDQREADQQLLDALVAFATDVADPRLFDGLDPISAARLLRARKGLDQVVQWFAAQRLLDADPLDLEPFPGFGASTRHLASSASRGAAGLVSGIRNCPPIQGSRVTSGGPRGRRARLRSVSDFRTNSHVVVGDLPDS